MISATAKTIWAQLTMQTKMAIGARDVLADGDKITMRVGGRAHRKITIKLNGLDLYDISFGKLTRGLDFIVLKIKMSVGVEELNETVYRMVNGH